MHTSVDRNTKAAILDSGGIQRLAGDQAMNQLWSALTTRSLKSRDVYAIFFYDQNAAKEPSNDLDTWNTVFTAYWRSWRKLSKIARVHFTHPDEDHSARFRKRDFGDVCVYWVQGPWKHVKEEIDSASGILFLPSHLDTESLGLPALPDAFLEQSVVVQVKTGESDSRSTKWNPWEVLAHSVADEEDLDPSMERDTIEWRKRFMSEYKSWTSAQVAKESGSNAKNRSAIASRWAAARRIFSVPFGGKLWFPRFQFRDGRPIPAVSKVIKNFPEHASGWELAYFFTTPNSFIGGHKPVELLKDRPNRLDSLSRSFASPADAF